MAMMVHHRHASNPKTCCSLAFMPPDDEMNEVVSSCLPHIQLWVSNLAKFSTQWLIDL